MFKISNSQKNIKNKRAGKANNNKPCYRDHISQMKYEPMAKSKAVGKAKAVQYKEQNNNYKTQGAELLVIGKHRGLV